MIQRYGRIDVLVNNAGVGSAGAAEESSVSQARSVFDVNVFGVIRMTKAVLPHMRARGGGRINVSSVAGLVPQPFMAPYVASKHAVEGYSESLDHEVRKHGVRVLLVEPANISTPFDANMVQADAPLPVYAQQRHIFDEVIAAAMKNGDKPAVAAKVIVEQPPPRDRNCATPPARGPAASARCAASSRPGPSTGRSANSTGWSASGSPALVAHGNNAHVASSRLP